MEFGWLRDAIRLSVNIPLSSSVAGGLDDHFDEHNPRFRKLVEGLIFTRHFVPTYNFVILGCISLFSALHWTRRLLRWRKQRLSKLQAAGKIFGPPSRIPDHMVREEQCSSGSSPIEGTASPARKELEDEDTPLLRPKQTIYPRRTIVSTVDSVLMHQPPPIPFVNKALPTNGTSVVILALLALNCFYMCYNINFNLFELFVLADRFGLIFVANLPLLYVLAAKNQPLQILMGRSYESLNLFHRRLGELLCFEALFHSTAMLGVWLTLLRHSGLNLLEFLLMKVVLLGIGALFSYELLYFTSLASFRQRWYELFLATHVLLQIAALVFVFFHHPNSRPYVGVALAIFLVDRLVYRLRVKSIQVKMKTQILEDEETVRLSATIVQKNPQQYLLGTSVKNGWQPTDHIFISLSSLSQMHIIQAHPFTIASAAPATRSRDAKLELLIRAQDGFSRDLLNAARLHKQLQFRIDGPYGSSHAREMLEDSDVALVIAGGSGIAVGWPLVQHLLEVLRTSDCEVASQLALQRQKIILIWIIRESAHISWLGRDALAYAENRGAEIIIPRATEEIGRPDLAKMIMDIVKIFTDVPGKKMRVVASGPDGMVRLIRNTCAKFRGEGKDIKVAVEKFGW